MPKQFQNNPNTAALAFLQKYTKPHKNKLMGAVMLDVVGVCVFVGQMWVLAQFFSKLAQFYQNSNAATIIAPLAYQALMAMLPIFIGLFVLRFVVGYWRDKLVFDSGIHLVKQARSELLLGLSALALSKNRLGSDGQLTSRITYDTDELIGYGRFWVQKLSTSIIPIILLIIIAYFAPKAAMVLLIALLILLVMMAVIGIKTAKKSREQLDKMAQMSGRFLDWVRGTSTLVRLGAVDIAKKDINNSAAQYKNGTLGVLKIAFLNSMMLELIASLSIAMVAIYLGCVLLSGDLSAVGMQNYADVIFVLLLIPEFFLSLRQLAMEYHAKGAALAAAGSLLPLMGVANAKPTHNHPIHKNDTIAICAQAVVVEEEGAMRLSAVSFNLAFGQKMALLGASGSGKTTLFASILGLCEHSGVISFGADNLRFGYLSQSPTLLNISIADNLRLVGENICDDQIRQVLSDVGLWNQIAALPRGVDTVLGERGGGLSGGQAQRLAIAMLLLQKADIWLLDEPTEHLDEATKDHIHQLLRRVGADKTWIWASHDTSATWVDVQCVLS